MMRVLRPLLTVAICWGLVVLHATPASAGVWDWVEKLSGPGPFKGTGFSVDLFCVPTSAGNYPPRGEGQIVLPARCDREADPYVNLTIGAGFAKADRGFPQAQVVSVEPMLMFPLSGLLEPNRFTRAVDVGAGTGIFIFYGDGFDTAWRPSIQGSARFYFLSLLSADKSRRWRFVRLEYTPKILFTYLSDERLGVPDRGTQFEPFDEGVELNGGKSLRIVFDFAVFQ
jgi:hypothetical protein